MHHFLSFSQKGSSTTGLPLNFRPKTPSTPHHGDGTQTRGTRGSFAVSVLLSLVELHQSRKDVFHLTVANSWRRFESFVRHFNGGGSRQNKQYKTGKEEETKRKEGKMKENMTSESHNQQRPMTPD